MAYTFGGATGDDVNWTSAGTINARPSVQLFAGWFYPTTLTATRCLFAFGTVSRIAIDTTTSELRLTKDNNSTDDVKRTTTLGLAVNNWYFLAFLLNSSSSAAGVWTVWKGTADTPPVEHALTNVTTGSGNNQSSTALCIGNSGSAGTLAFQGDIEDFWLFYDVSTTETQSYLQVVADGTTSTDENSRVLQNFVNPLWAGNYRRIFDRTRRENDRGLLDYVPLRDNNTRRYGNNVANNTVTINGATVSPNRGPRVNSISAGIMAAHTPHLRRAGGRVS